MGVFDKRSSWIVMVVATLGFLAATLLLVRFTVGLDTPSGMIFSLLGGYFSGQLGFICAVLHDEH